MDAVARRAGHVEGNHTLFAEDGVDKGGFADVGAADNGENGVSGVLLFFFGVGEVFQHVFDKVVDAVAVCAGDNVRLAQREFVKLGRQHGTVAALAFVHRQIDGARALAQAVGDDFVLRRETGAGVDEEDDGVGFVNGLQGLLGHFVQDAAVDNGLETAGVDNQIRFAAEAAVAVVAVAGEAGQIVHECVFAAGEAVEEGGFADVRPAHKGDGWFHVAVSVQAV
ncbi:hypothetical protein HMPREF9120_02596 [Neisseria sp. oral taxon 020 str. F0370]|nr:hypothetical protein HMPREF9120_02596 [Neisseria sp. oral taxon 020 str. F0370]